MKRPKETDAQRRDRVIATVAVHIHRTLQNLELDREYLADNWSRYRDRAGLVESLDMRPYQALTARDLLVLEPDVAIAIVSFYRVMNEFRYYVTFTEDMPGALFARYERSTTRMELLGERAIELMGGVPERALAPYIGPWWGFEAVTKFFGSPRRDAPPVPEDAEEY